MPRRHKKRSKVDELKQEASKAKSTHKKLESDEKEPALSWESLWFWGQPISKKKSTPVSTVIKTKSLGGEREIRSALSVKNKESSPAYLPGAEAANAHISPLARPSRSKSANKKVSSKLAEPSAKRHESKPKVSKESRRRSLSGKRPEELKKREKSKHFGDRRNSKDINVKESNTKPSKKKSKKSSVPNKALKEAVDTPKQVKPKPAKRKSPDRTLDNIPPLPEDLIATVSPPRPTLVDTETQSSNVSELKSVYEDQGTTTELNINHRAGTEKVHWSTPTATHKLITPSDYTQTGETSECRELNLSDTVANVQPREAKMAESAVQCDVQPSQQDDGMKERLFSIEQAVVDIRSTISELTSLVQALRSDSEVNLKKVSTLSDATKPNSPFSSNSGNKISASNNWPTEVNNNNLDSSLSSLSSQLAQIKKDLRHVQVNEYHVQPSVEHPVEHTVTEPLSKPEPDHKLADQILNSSNFQSGEIQREPHFPNTMGENLTFAQPTMFLYSDGGLLNMYNPSSYVIIDSDDDFDSGASESGAKIEELSESQALLLEQELKAKTNNPIKDEITSADFFNNRLPEDGDEIEASELKTPLLKHKSKVQANASVKTDKKPAPDTYTDKIPADDLTPFVMENSKSEVSPCTKDGPNSVGIKKRNSEVSLDSKDNTDAQKISDVKHYSKLDLQESDDFLEELVRSVDSVSQQSVDEKSTESEGHASYQILVNNDAELKPSPFVDKNMKEHFTNAVAESSLASSTTETTVRQYITKLQDNSIDPKLSKGHSAKSFCSSTNDVENQSMADTKILRNDVLSEKLIEPQAGRDIGNDVTSHNPDEESYLDTSETSLVETESIQLPTPKPKKRSLKSKLAKAFGFGKKDYNVESKVGEKASKSSSINVDDLFNKLPPPTRIKHRSTWGRKKSKKETGSVMSHDESFDSGSSMPQHPPPPPPSGISKPSPMRIIKARPRSKSTRKSKLDTSTAEQFDSLIEEC